MAAPVWILSVDLQTKTATFQTGMADAARAAHGAFGSIRSGAGEMAVGVSKGGVDVRHSLGLVDNVIRGAHAQAMADLVRMYAQSALVMNTLPIAAAAAGLALIGGIAYEAAEHVAKLKEAAEKLKTAITNQDTAGNNAFRQLDDQILKAEMHAAELSNHYLAALKIQLTLIDHQSLEQLVKSFEGVEKAADATFKGLGGHWYTFDSGSKGASHALDQFKTQYENLLSHGKDKEASDLLAGTLKSAQEILKAQQTVNSNRTGTGLFGPDVKDPDAWYGALVKLQQTKSGYSKQDVESQQALVSALEQQAGIESRVNVLKNKDSGNAKTTEGNEAAARRAAAAKESISAQMSLGASAIAADKATADAQLAIHRASIEARLQSDLDFAKRELDMKETANQESIAALDKSGKDYQVQLKTLNDKNLELQQQYQTQVAELKARASIEENQRDTTALEQGIREQIDATKEGTAARLAAIDAGIREEQVRNMQDTDSYRQLLTQRVEAARQAAEEEAKIKLQTGLVHAQSGDAAREAEIKHQEKMAQIKQGGGGMDFTAISQQQKQLDLEYQSKREMLDKELELYRAAGQDQIKNAEATQRKLELLDQQTLAHSQELDQQEIQAKRQLWNTIAQGYAQTFMGVLEGHETLNAAMSHLVDQAMTKFIAASIQRMITGKDEQLTDAKVAAAGAMRAMSSIPIVGPELGAVAAAAVFASAMAFNMGGVVPDGGKTDSVPAMLTPGEGVVPNGVMDGLRNVARNGGFQSGNHTHIHMQYRPTFHVQTIDRDGVEDMLDKHTQTFNAHFEKSLRRMNR